MTKPTRPKKDTRAHHLGMRLTDEELRLARIGAKKNGLTVSHWARILFRLNVDRRLGYVDRDCAA